MRLSMAEVRLLRGAASLLEIMSLRIGRTSTWILPETWIESRKCYLAWWNYLRNSRYKLEKLFLSSSNSKYSFPIVNLR